MSRPVSDSCVMPTWLVCYSLSVKGYSLKIDTVKKLAELIFEKKRSCHYELEIPLARSHEDFQYIKTALIDEIIVLEEGDKKIAQLIWNGNYKGAYDISKSSRSPIPFYEENLASFFDKCPMPYQWMSMLSVRGAFTGLGRRFSPEKLGELIKKETQTIALFIKLIDDPTSLVKFLPHEEFIDFLLSNAAVCYQEVPKHERASNQIAIQIDRFVNQAAVPFYKSWMRLMIEWGLTTSTANYNRLKQVLTLLKLPITEKYHQEKEIEITFFDYLIHKSYTGLLEELEVKTLPACLEQLIKKCFREKEYVRKMILMGYLQEFRPTDAWKTIAATCEEAQYIDRFLEIYHLSGKHLDLAIKHFDHLLSQEELEVFKNNHKLPVSPVRLDIWENETLEDINAAIAQFNFPVIQAINDIENIQIEIQKDSQKERVFYEAIGNYSWRKGKNNNIQNEKDNNHSELSLNNPILAKSFYEIGRIKWDGMRDVLNAHAVLPLRTISKNAKLNEEKKQNTGGNG